LSTFLRASNQTDVKASNLVRHPINAQTTAAVTLFKVAADVAFRTLLAWAWCQAVPLSIGAGIL